MSHEPPVPAGNQSPFPLQEPKHDANGPPPGADVARTPEAARGSAAPSRKGLIVGGLVATGVAALAAAGAWAYATEPNYKRKERKRRKKAR